MDDQNCLHFAQSLHFFLMDQQDGYHLRIKIHKGFLWGNIFNIYFSETAEASLDGRLENVHIFMFDPKSKMALKMFIYFFMLI